MTATDDLRQILDDQTLDPDGPELRALRGHRASVGTILKAAFPGADFTLRYGGSKAKGTMIKAAYDLDIVVYVHHGDTTVGRTLAEIYGAVHGALAPYYDLEEKTSAIRLYASANGRRGDDLQIDVVPGRFVDDTQTDCFLYQASGEKGRLKTNLKTHIDHIRFSGVTDTLKLLKLTRVIYDLEIKQFALDLLGVELLKGTSGWPLGAQLAHVLTAVQESKTPIAIEDPANPSGNDLSGLLRPSVWNELSTVAGQVLNGTAASSWAQVLGEPKAFTPTSPAILSTAAEAVYAPTKPWTSRT